MDFALPEHALQLRQRLADFIADQVLPAHPEGLHIALEGGVNAGSSRSRAGRREAAHGQHRGVLQHAGGARMSRRLRPLKAPA